MQPLFIPFGLLAVGAGLFFQFGAGPETRDGWNWFMVVCGLVMLIGGLGTIPHDKPQPAPAQKKQPERKAETPAEIAEREEREWRTDPKSRSPLRCAAQFRAYVERGRPDQAREFTDAMSTEFHRAVLIGAKIITEHERS